MTKDDILRMAQQAGLTYPDKQPWMAEFLERFAQLVAEYERQECAKVCDGLLDQIGVSSLMDGEYVGIADCARAIRRRSLQNKEGTG